MLAITEVWVPAFSELALLQTLVNEVHDDNENHKHSNWREDAQQDEFDALMVPFMDLA